MHVSSILGPSLAINPLICALLLFCGCESPVQDSNEIQAENEGLCIALGVCACSEPPCTAETLEFTSPEIVAPSANLPAEVESQQAHNNLDIAWFEGRLFFAFRTAPSHFASADTVLYVVSTTDHQSWRFEGRFHEGSDIREPRFMVLNGQLTLFYARLGTDSLEFEPGVTKRTHYLGPDAWSTPEIVFEQGFIPWRIKYRNGEAYLMGYTGGEHIYSTEDGELQVHWLRSADGETWSPVVGDGIILRGGVSETDFAFMENGAVIAVGRNEAGDEDGFGSKICRAEPDALDVWRCELDLRKFDSPHVFRHGDQVYLIGRRNITDTGHYDLGGDGPLSERRLTNLTDYWVHPKRCALWGVNTEALTVTHLVDFPTAGDTCFASTVAIGGNQRLMYDYTSPPDAPETIWVEGQNGPTMIYRTTLVFAETPTF